MFDKIIKELGVVYQGFILGLIMALLASNSLWLEMRFNTGYFIYLGLLIALILRFSRIRCYCDYWKANLTLHMVLFSVIGFRCGGSIGQLQIIPASIIREGLFLKGIALSTINQMVILVVLVVQSVLLGRFYKNIKEETCSFS